MRKRTKLWIFPAAILVAAGAVTACAEKVEPQKIVHTDAEHQQAKTDCRPLAEEQFSKYSNHPSLYAYAFEFDMTTRDVPDGIKVRGNAGNGGYDPDSVFFCKVEFVDGVAQPARLTND